MMSGPHQNIAIYVTKISISFLMFSLARRPHKQLRKLAAIPKIVFTLPLMPRLISARKARKPVNPFN